MSEEQNEVLEQRYLLERRMYRLDPAPPKLPAQEYIVRYLTEKEDKYLACLFAEILLIDVTGRIADKKLPLKWGNLTKK